MSVRASSLLNRPVANAITFSNDCFNVVGRTGECGVGHDVHGECRHVVGYDCCIERRNDACEMVLGYGPHFTVGDQST